jgi:protein SCO1/2
MTNNLKRVQAYADVKDLHIASFSVDPERDSAQQLQSFIKKFSVKDDNWDFITGDKKELYKLARKSFLIVATDGDGGETDFIHSESLVLIDKQKRIRGYYNGTEEDEVNQLVKDIKKLSKEN